MMVPEETERVPARGAAATRPVILVVITLAAIALLAGGCSWFGVSDRQLGYEMARAREAIDRDEPESVINRLERLAWLRQDSIEVRRLLVEACLAVDSFESRRLAEKTLRELSRLDPGNLDYRFGLAEVLLTRGFDRDASKELEHLLDQAPDHAGAHLAVGELHAARYRRFRLRRDLDQMLASFSRAADLDPEWRQAGARRAEALMLDGQWDSALAYLDRLLERWPDDPWLLALKGTCLSRPGTYPEAAHAFSLAFERMDGATRGPFRSLRYVESPYALARYDLLVPDEREDHLRIFWRSRDPLPVTRVNEREIEHWRRVVMADLLYAHARLGLRGWETARGEMYIRYGAPLYEEYNLGGIAGLIALPSWYHIYDVGGHPLAVKFYDVVLSGEFYLPFSWLPTAADQASYTAPESHEHDYGGRWVPLAVTAGEFRGPAPATRTEVYLAVPVESLAEYHGSTLELGTVAFDRDWYEIARTEEVVDLDQVTIAGESDRALVYQTNLELKPETYWIATQVLGEAGSVVGTETQEVSVGSFGRRQLELSALELAFSVDRLGPERFQKGDVTVIPNATGEVRGSEVLVLYFEIYHLAEIDGRSHYSLAYRIAPRDREGRSLFGRLASAFSAETFIESSFVEEGTGATVRRHLAIDVGKLVADRYQLDLEVTDLETGARVSRTAVFSRTSGAE